MAWSASTSQVMESLMRLGYVTRGLVYGVVGLLALQLVLGGGGALTNPQGAIIIMGQTGLGKFPLYFILVGLFGYGLWGFVRAIADPLHKGTQPKGIAERIGYALSGASYLLLALATFSLIFGGAAAQPAQAQRAAAAVLAQPMGMLVLGVVAVIIVGVGLAQMYEGFRMEFGQQFNMYALTGNQRQWIMRLGRFGMAARGLVVALVGAFLLLAAYTRDASRVQNLDGVLSAILHAPVGPLLLGIVALGLIAFGAYSIMSGFWLRLKR